MWEPGLQVLLHGTFSKEQFEMTHDRSGLARRTAGGLCMMLSFLSFGCGEPAETVPELVAVSGKVTYQGKALADASVTFVPADAEEEATERNRLIRPSGKTDADGAYELVWAEHTGAPPGKYNVIVTAFAPSTDDDVRPDSLIPEMYGSPKTSGLSRVVKEEGDNVINIDLQ
jgi:hypothetical protein